jgi:hypothetical protein
VPPTNGRFDGAADLTGVIGAKCHGVL